MRLWFCRPIRTVGKSALRLWSAQFASCFMKRVSDNDSNMVIIMNISRIMEPKGAINHVGLFDYLACHIHIISPLYPHDKCHEIYHFISNRIFMGCTVISPFYDYPLYYPNISYEKPIHILEYCRWTYPPLYIYRYSYTILVGGTPFIYPYAPNFYQIIPLILHTAIYVQGPWIP